MSSFLPQTTGGGRYAFPGEPGGGLYDQPYAGLGMIADGAFVTAWFRVSGTGLTGDKLRYLGQVLEQALRSAGWSVDKTEVDTSNPTIRVYAQLVGSAAGATNEAETAAATAAAKVPGTTIKAWVEVRPSVTTAPTAPPAVKPGIPSTWLWLGGGALVGAVLFTLLRR